MICKCLKCGTEHGKSEMIGCLTMMIEAAIVALGLSGILLLTCAIWKPWNFAWSLAQGSFLALWIILQIHGWFLQKHLTPVWRKIIRMKCPTCGAIEWSKGRYGGGFGP